MADSAYYRQQYLWAIFAISATAIQLVQGVASQDDQCLVRNIKVQENFNLEKYLGTWYELKWIPENWFPPEYNYKDFLIDYVRHNSTALYGNWVGREADEKAKCINGTNIILTTETPGKFLYLRRNQTSGGVLQSDYWVVLTDYNNYALVWGCREITNGRCTKEDSWVWGRRSTLSKTHMDLIDAKIAETCLNQTAFFTTYHTKACPISETSGSAIPQFGMTTFLLLFLFWTQT